MTKPRELEYKSISFVIKSVDDVKGIFKGYAASFDKVDLVNDTMDSKAFDNTITEFSAGRKKICVNFDHMKSIVLATNLFSIAPDEYGLLVEFQVSEESKAQYPNIFAWAVKAAQEGNLCMSVGGYVMKSSLGEERYIRWSIGNPVDIIQEFDLDHIAITNYPVDAGAKMLEVKSKTGEDENMAINEEIVGIDGKVSAIKFLKTYKSRMSNNTVENFVNKLKNMWDSKEKLDIKSINANNNELEIAGMQSQGDKTASGIGSDSNKLRYEEIAKYLKK